jgi:serine phosphatase RsbU (regulator of sigma subunit)
MPGIGGIEATRCLRELAGDRWMPILFVSALSDVEDMVRGLKAGGDDYLPKPVNLELMLAKICALQRIAVLQGKLRRANASLEAYRASAERDMSLARTVMERMIESASMEVEGVELWLSPAAELSGDLLVARKGGDGSIYVLLADAMGHGLPAAIPVMPLIQVFSAMTSEGRAVSTIVREMNVRLKAFLPCGNFVAVTLVKIDRASRIVDIWNGGNPAAMLVDVDGQVIRRFASRQLALGILSDQDFDATTEICEWGDARYLTLFSDGLADACSRQGDPFGEERIYALAGVAMHRRIKEALAAHLDGQALCDDISLATLDLR